MRIKNIVFRIITFSILSIYLSSCASSSYTEKYGRSTTTEKKKEDKITRTNGVEDEISIESSRISNDEVDELK